MRAFFALKLLLGNFGGGCRRFSHLQTFDNL